MKRKIGRSALRGGLAAVLTCALLLSGCTAMGGNTDVTGNTQGLDTVTDTTVDEATTPFGTEETNAPQLPSSGDGTLTVPTTPANGPAFSYTGGVYTEALSVEMAAPEGYTIRYTTDGSVPTFRSEAYAEAIEMKYRAGTATTIRAACFDGNTLTGAVATHTYVMADAKESTLYTVMISVEEDDMDDILAAPNEKVERPAHVEIVTPDGTTVISQDAGIRLFGGSSRSLAQKSFKLIARKTGYFGEGLPYVGKGTFRYALFPERVVKGGENAGQVLDRYDSFILRNGGNDSLLHTACDPEDATLLRDGLANNFAAEVTEHLEYSLSQFAAVYINGEYYGLLDMRENLNEDFVKRVWGVADDDVVVIKSELDTTRFCGEQHESHGCRYCGVWFFYQTDDNQNAESTMNEWIKFCKEIVSKVDASDTEYNAAYQKLEENVDLEGLMEWYALSLYLCNTDWPHNNVKLWKYTGEPIEGIEITDGKWRFMTRDMDMTMGRYSSPHLTSDLDSRATVDSFWRTLGNYVSDYHSIYSDSGETKLYGDALYLQGLFAFCMRNDEFRAEFADYCRTLISEENQALLDSIYDGMVEEVTPGMNDHIKRWRGAIGSGYRLGSWKDACESLTGFMSRRPAKFEEYLELCLSMYE